MSIAPWLAELVGTFDGPNRVWLAPGEPVRESVTTATVARVAQGRFVSIAYTWSDGGQPQDGLIVLGENPAAGGYEASWVDSWHMGDVIMRCASVATSGDKVAVGGSYAAPPGPDWGWRIEVSPQGSNGFDLRMFNVTPDGQEALAVEANYRRR